MQILSRECMPKAYLSVSERKLVVEALGKYNTRVTISIILIKRMGCLTLKEVKQNIN